MEATNTTTPIDNMAIYCTFVRNHGPTGTFKDVIEDLPRIKALGTDILWLLPIHPIGKQSRKGTLGSPYSIIDYNAINPEFGTLEDFQELVNEAHQLNIKIMIDIVFRHTAWDSVLLETHPEWYKQKEGKPTSSNPHWSDIIDLDWTNPVSGLWEYLFDSLVHWVALGVDGFRCDVGNALPIDFWIQARAVVAQSNPNAIWLCETWHPRGMEGSRERGENIVCDAELYRAFDITYDYDLFPLFGQVLNKKMKNPTEYLQYLRYQQTILPANYSKMRFLENHDKSRAINSCKSNVEVLKIWTAFQIFNRGPFLIFSGQESLASQTPSLFDRDPIPWKDMQLSPFFTTLLAIKKRLFGTYKVLSVGPVTACWYDWKSGKGFFGIFDDAQARVATCTPVPDGTYGDLVNGGSVQVSQGKMRLQTSVVIFEFEQAKLSFKPLASPLF